MNKFVAGLALAAIGFVIALAQPQTTPQVAAAKGGSGMSLITGSFTYIDRPGLGPLIEQQSVWPWVAGEVVLNPWPGTVMWNADDIGTWQYGGTLDAGQTFTHSFPSMLDNFPHLIAITASASQGRTFRLTISVPELNFSYSQDFTSYGRMCVEGQAPLSDPRMQSIPNSNGGVGVPITYQWTLTATDSRGLGRQAYFGAHAPYGNFTNKDAHCGGHNENNGGYAIPIPDTDFGIVGP